MAVKIKLNGVSYNIADAIMKINGEVKKNMPLQMLIGGMKVNFMSYGPTDAEIKMLIEVQPEGFDSELLSKIINSLGSVAETVVVTFASGEFICNKPIIIERSNVTLIGKGSNTILKSNSSSNINNIVYLKGSLSNSLENLYVYNLTLDGLNITSNCINMYQTGSETKMGAVVENCVLQNSINNGIYLNYGNINNTISNNTIQNNGSYGIDLNGSINNIIISNTIQNTGSYGIILSNSSNNNTISNNTIQNNGSYGIVLYNNSSNNNTISNTIQNNGSYGIFIILSNSSNNTISNNTIQNNGSYGIVLYNNSSNNNTISNNTIQNNGSNGIYLNNSNTEYSENNKICNNCITYNGASGINMGTLFKNTMVQSNRISNNKSTNFIDSGENTIKNFNQTT